MLNYSSAFRDYYNKGHLEKTRSTVHSLYGLYLIAMLIQPSSSQRNNRASLSTLASQVPYNPAILQCSSTYQSVTGSFLN